MSGRWEISARQLIWKKTSSFRKFLHNKIMTHSPLLFANSNLECVAGSKNLFSFLLFSLPSSFPNASRVSKWNSSWFSSVQKALLYPKQISKKAIHSLAERYFDLYNGSHNTDLSPVAEATCYTPVWPYRTKKGELCTLSSSSTTKYQTYPWPYKLEQGVCVALSMYN